MNRNKISEILYILPLALIIGVTPLVIHYKKIPLGEVVASYWIKDYNIDFFSYYKMWAFLIFVLLAFISLYTYIKKEKKIKKTFYYLPAGIYILMIAVSTIFSECKLTSMYGFPDRYEGMPVLIGYVLVLILVINLIRTKRQVKFLLVILLISAIIIGIIGFYQFFGLDFFQTHVGKKIILSDATSFDQLIGKLDFKFEGKNIIYSTFYNPNYAGSYFVMLFMLTLVMYLFAESRPEKVLYGAINLLMFANWLGSLSRAGILGGIFSFLVTGFLLKNEIKKRWRSLVIILICFAAVFTFMDLYTEGKLRREFISLGDETKLALKGKIAEIEEIETENGVLLFQTAEQRFKINFNSSGHLILKDNKGEILPYYKSNYRDYIYIKDKQYLDFKFRVLGDKNSKIIELYYGDKQINFVTDLSLNNFWVIGMKSNVYPFQKVKNWGLEGKEKLASKRGYIWSRSLPLLKQTVVTGFGPDTYAIYFPQEDWVGKFKAYGNAAIIVDKPHNMYLQTAINTGLISLIAVILLFAVYFFRSLKLYWKNNFDSWFARAGISIFAAFIGYVFAGFFNDSVISVAPVFWTLLGMGIMIELRLRGCGNYKV